MTPEDFQGMMERIGYDLHFRHDYSNLYYRRDGIEFIYRPSGIFQIIDADDEEVLLQGVTVEQMLRMEGEILSGKALLMHRS